MKVTPWERGRFKVTSESGRGEYVVDLLEHNCFGWCDCRDFQIRIEAEYGQSQRPQRKRCKHINRVIEYLGRKLYRLAGIAPPRRFADLAKAAGQVVLRLRDFEKQCDGKVKPNAYAARPLDQDAALLAQYFPEKKAPIPVAAVECETPF